MQGKYKVITLCGSTKFKDAFIEAQKKLTLEGNIVISVGLFGHFGDEEVWHGNTKEMLDDMHRAKIDMADEIFVINVDGYIGDSTRSEIDYAISKGKDIRFLEKSNIKKPPKDIEEDIIVDADDSLKKETFGDLEVGDDFILKNEFSGVEIPHLYIKIEPIEKETNMPKNGDQCHTIIGNALNMETRRVQYFIDETEVIEQYKSHRAI